MQNIFPFESRVSPGQRKHLMRQEPRLVWFTGLSGSGKSTLAMRLESHLFQQGYKVYLLDGDNVRHGLNSDLGFSAQDRHENIRRVGEVAAMMLDAGLVVLCAFISPYAAERTFVRNTVGFDRFTEVFVDCPVQVCEERDTKGLYAKARRGLISNFTGISAPYEAPAAPDVAVRTDTASIEESLQEIVQHVVPLLELKDAPRVVASV
ncbi:adenylyl-sulfate kinase [Pontibacter roseus]|uniref:adenylyl-sulfate kinase n=1 Tax=Pontibacter roseus TaxID=336989 RepID=UPI000366199B|nr:adenylyl-sulfate kinase [Pontibacter roseus]